MTQILETHIHKLRFRIDSDAPEKYMKEWKKLKNKLEDGENKFLCEEIKRFCKLEINKNLPILNRCEGGLGGDNNITNKQIRFRKNFSINFDNDIILLVQNSDVEKWTYEELDDLMFATIVSINKFMEARCTNGCIEMVNKKNLEDDYLYNY